MKGYHCTTTKKLRRYEESGAIFPPVRFWLFRDSAEQWAKKTRRDVVLEIEVGEHYPLPDHQPRGHAHWSPEYVRNWQAVQCT